jgi:hypothetical protein
MIGQSSKGGTTPLGQTKKRFNQEESLEDIYDISKASTIGYDILFGNRINPTLEEVNKHLINPTAESTHLFYRIIKIMKRFHSDTEREDGFFHNHNRLPEESDSGSDFKDSANGDRDLGGTMRHSRGSLSGSLMNMTFQSQSPNKKGRYG